MPVNAEQKQYKRRKKSWAMCRDFFEGEEQVKNHATEYLPRPSGMSKDTDYGVS